MKKNQRGELCYSSFTELAEAWNIKPRKLDEDKVRSQKEKFLSHHKCKACGEPLTYMGGNLMSCTNEKCKGIKITKEDAEGNKVVRYEPSFDLLEDKYAAIAARILED